MKKISAKMLLVLALVSMVMIAGFAAPVMAADVDPMEYEGKVRIGSQTVNEAIILAWMANLLVQEYTGLDTYINTDFTASSVVHQAMVSDELDIYISWTGTQLTGILRYEGPNLSREESFKMVKEGFEQNFNFTWIEPLGFNNTYTMAIKREVAEELGIEKASDLKEYAGKWTLGTDENFDTRPDGYPGWSEAYGIEFDDVLPMQYSMMYMAIAGGEVDAIAAYSTDSRIKKLDLVTLEDDLDYFPDYSAAYVVRMDTLKKYPALDDVLGKLSGTIDEATMSSLNFRHDNGEEAEVIAREYLQEVGLIK